MLLGKTVLTHITCGQGQLTDGTSGSQVSRSATFPGKPKRTINGW